MSPHPPENAGAPPDSRIRVLIADDHVTVREGLAAIIGRQTDMQVVAVAADGREAVQGWLAHRPDVALLDLRMPHVDGVAALQQIRGHAPAARIIVLTTFDTSNEVMRAIRAGAKGYLLKDAPREELLRNIRGVHQGQTCIPAALIAKLATELRDETLSPRELDVLRMLAIGKSNKVIGAALSIGETTVKTHMRGIFGKLNVLSRTEAVAVAVRRGLVDLAGPD